MPCFIGLISLSYDLTEKKVRKNYFSLSVSRGLEAGLTSIQSRNSWQIAKYYNIRPINAALASVLHEIQFASPVCLIVRLLPPQLDPKEG